MPAKTYVPRGQATWLSEEFLSVNARSGDSRVRVNLSWRFSTSFTGINLT